jgi:hypothetical protein
MPEILARSDLEVLVAMREARMRKFGFRGMAEYEAALKKKVHFDPLAFAAAAARKKVLVFVGTRDTTVPALNQFNLVRAFRAASVSLALDHVDAILHVFTSNRGQVENFFKQNLR